MAQYKVSDAGDARKYFTILPNIIDDTDLTVYAFRLYAHIKRRAGDDGVCNENIENIAKACHMSQGMVTKARRELVDKKLIWIEEIRNPNGGFAYQHIHIVDMWQQNTSSYSEPAGSQSVPASTPHEPTSSHSDTKEEPREEEPKKKIQQEEGKRQALAHVSRSYEKEIGGLTPAIKDALEAALQDYSVEWIDSAIEEAALNNARNWKYVKAILERWGKDGFRSVHKNGNGKSGNSAKPRGEYHNVGRDYLEKLKNGNRS